MKTKSLKVEVRKAMIKDINDILRLNFKLFQKERREYDKLLDMSWTYGEGRKYFQGRIRRGGGLIIVAEHKGKCVGYLCGGISKMESYRIQKKQAELENMFVEKKFRGQGIGRKLVEMFFDWCRENKVELVLVSASFANSEGVHFYEKLGFKGYSIVLEIKL